MRITMTVITLAGIISLGAFGSELRAAQPVQVDCDSDSTALSDLLLSGVVADGDILAIAGTCVEPPGGLTESFEMNNNITLKGQGKGATLSGGGPVLRVAVSTTVVVENVTITGGDTGGPIPGNIPAGIENNGNLTLIRSFVNGNSDLGGPGSTGGILNNGNLTLIGSSINGNSVRSGGLPTGGLLNNAGCTAILIDSEVRLNSANTRRGPGTGGIHNMGILILSGSTVAENEAFAGADVTGGIRNTGGTVMLLESTVRENTASNGSVSFPPVGGIMNDGGRVSLSHSTVSRNSVLCAGECAKAVGGIYNDSAGVDTLVLTNDSTVRKNEAVGAVDDVGGIASPVGIPLPNIENSIIKNNIPKDCDFTDPACEVAP